MYQVPHQKNTSQEKGPGRKLESEALEFTEFMLLCLVVIMWGQGLQNLLALLSLNSRRRD